MSYTTLKLIEKNGDVVDYKEYQNAHGGIPFIWDGIYNRYLKDPEKDYDCWLINSEKLWPLYKEESIELWIRQVLLSTYDYAVVKRENLIKIADLYMLFLTNFPRPNTVCHIDTWAHDIVDISKYHKDCIGVCIYATSVGEDMWWIYEINDEDDEGRPYNLNKDKKHWYVFDLLRER